MSDKKFIDNVLKKEVDFPKDLKLSNEIKDLIKKMLIKTPKERISV